MKKKPKLTKAARECVSGEIRAHHKKGKPRAQSVAIAYSVCRRKGFRIPERVQVRK